MAYEAIENITFLEGVRKSLRARPVRPFEDDEPAEIVQKLQSRIFERIAHAGFNADRVAITQNGDIREVFDLGTDDFVCLVTDDYKSIFCNTPEIYKTILDTIAYISRTSSINATYDWREIYEEYHNDEYPDEEFVAKGLACFDELKSELTANDREDLNTVRHRIYAANCPENIMNICTGLVEACDALGPLWNHFATLSGYDDDVYCGADYFWICKSLEDESSCKWVIESEYERMQQYGSTAEPFHGIQVTEIHTNNAEHCKKHREAWYNFSNNFIELAKLAYGTPTEE